MSAYTLVWVKFQREGIHKYPAALTDPALKDVEFLGHPHRHIFFHKVAIQVFHEDRDIEFVQFKRWLESLYDSNEIELNFKSCEMLSTELYDCITAKYPKRDIIIEISEDGENGCECHYPYVETEYN